MYGLKIKDLHGKPRENLSDSDTEKVLKKSAGSSKVKHDLRKIQQFKKRAADKPMIDARTKNDLFNPRERDLQKRLALMKKNAKKMKKI
jgi:hypothetical protein